MTFDIMRLMINIALVLGTARKERCSVWVAKYLTKLFAEHKEAKVTFVDVREHMTMSETIPPWGEGGVEQVPTDWRQIAADADAFVFVLPEYNRGYPGEWKLLIDSLYAEYKGKHVYVVGVSNGIFAGVRVADHVKPVLVELGLVLHKTALNVGLVDKIFNKEGLPEDDKFIERAQAFVDAVSNMK